MSEVNSFSIRLLGFSEYEKRLFGSITALTKGRTRSYRLAPGSTERADILVVNGDDPHALQAWQEQCDRGRTVPAVVAAKQPTQRAGTVHIRRPLIVTRVIAALDQVVVENLHFAPELVIEQGAQVSAVLNGTLKRMTSVAAEQSQHRVLVVDDSQSVLKLMEIELRISGVSGDFAESAEEAWQMLTKQKYNIVFLDVVLPGIDGYTMCKTIKKNGATKHIPVVMLTGKSSPFDRVRGKLAGCSSYLVKPVPHKALQKIFQRYLPTGKENSGEHPGGGVRPCLVGAQ